MSHYTHDQVEDMFKYHAKLAPGWAPGIKAYPLSTYLDRVALWRVITDIQDPTKLAPTLASRLLGGASYTATNLSFSNEYNQVLHGTTALQYLGFRGDLENGIPAIATGFDQLLDRLRHDYGEEDDAIQASSVELFETYVRKTNVDLLTFLNEWQRLFEQAKLHGHYDLPPVAKSHRLLRSANLSSSLRDHILETSDRNYAVLTTSIEDCEVSPRRRCRPSDTEHSPHCW